MRFFHRPVETEPMEQTDGNHLVSLIDSIIIERIRSKTLSEAKTNYQRLLARGDNKSTFID